MRLHSRYNAGPRGTSLERGPALVSNQNVAHASIPTFNAQCAISARPATSTHPLVLCHLFTNPPPPASTQPSRLNRVPCQRFLIVCVLSQGTCGPRLGTPKLD